LTLRLSPVFRFRRRRCLPLHVAGSVGSTALQRLYVVDDVPRTSAQGLARRGTRMLPLKPADHSARTLDVPVLVPQARCAPAGRSHGAAVLRHQGPTPQNQKQQEGGFPHRQSASNAIFNVRVARPPAYFILSDSALLLRLSSFAVIDSLINLKYALKVSTTLARKPSFNMISPLPLKGCVSSM
jgi:hypothetical protein